MRSTRVVLIVALVVWTFPSIAAAQTPALTFAELARRPELRPGRDLFITFALNANSAPQRFRAELIGIDAATIRLKMDPEFAALRTDLAVEFVDRGDSPVFAEPAYTIVEVPERRVARVSTIDSLSNGVWIGVAAGAAPTALACLRGCYPAYAGIGLAIGAGVGAGLGALVDLAHPAEGKVLYEAPGTVRSTAYRFVPIVSRERKGAMFVISW